VTTADDVAGIAVDMPSMLVEFDSYAPPFAKYTAKDGSGVQVLLISQTGDQSTLGGLYEIMQTLEIVPTDGARSRKSNSFSLTGENEQFISHTEASLSGGEIKGWTLIWPQGDDQRQTIAKDAMRASFSRLDGVLADAYSDGERQDIDLVAGLQIRRPDVVGTGFFVTAQGAVLTAAKSVSGCQSVTVEGGYEVDVTTTDDAFALLTPKESVAPRAVARFDDRLPALQSEVAASGFPYDGRLGQPSMNYGVVAEHNGLAGELDLLRLEMDLLAGENGAPLLNGRGAVVGMMSTDVGAERSLPQNVAFAYGIEKVSSFLSSAGVPVSAGSTTEALSEPEMARLGANLSTLVNCWK